MRIDVLKFVLGIIVAPIFLQGQSIVNTVHNLSVSGPGLTRAASETEICIFCHTPHNSSPQRPLWNREDPGTNYTLYNSSTIQAAPGQPDGASILCLSCHDGTVALGHVISRAEPIQFSSGATTIPDGASHLATDLSDDHPISFIYNTSLAASDGELADPSTLTGPVQLKNEKMQCTSCHDAHKDIHANFLVASLQYSTLCLYCHQKDYWPISTHNTSTATWNGSGDDPWFHTSYTSVAENGCENCHNPHTAGRPQQLTNYMAEETNCLVCHDGNVAMKDIQADLSKPYSHNVYTYSQVHDESESAQVQVIHVECVDCHNPHASNDAIASPPNAGGFLRGVRGLDTNGGGIDNVQYEFEICYRCHAGSPGSPGSPTSRQIEQNNTRLEFDLNNPSYHPVEGVGQNNNVPSLISPYTESSIIYCTDCHANDGSSTSAGPHGSIYPHILKYRYETADNTQESYQAYELCYQCHDRDLIVNDESTAFSKKVHKKHVVSQNAPCNACHDPHGISSSQGNIGNHSHLINFDLSIVSPWNSRLEFIDNGDLSGECYLVCHGEDHHPENY